MSDPSVPQPSNPPLSEHPADRPRGLPSLPAPQPPHTASSTPASYDRPRSASSISLPFSTMFRPGTVTAAGVILYALAGLSLILSCFLLAGVSGRGSGTYTQPDNALLKMIVVILGVFSVIYAVLAFFVMSGKRWAQVVTILLNVLSGVSSLVSFFSDLPGLSGCLAIVLNAVIIGLLLSPAAQSYYAHT